MHKLYAESGSLERAHFGASDHPWTQQFKHRFGRIKFMNLNQSQAIMLISNSTPSIRSIPFLRYSSFSHMSRSFCSSKWTTLEKGGRVGEAVLRISVYNSSMGNKKKSQWNIKSRMHRPEKKTVCLLR